MKTKGLCLFLGSAVVLSVVCFVAVIVGGHSPQKHVFRTYSYETGMTWSEGPDVKLDQSSMKKLNAELDEIIHQEAPGKDLHYPVVSQGKREVEVMYSGGQDVPEALREKLDAYIQKRLPELAREQVLP